MSLEFRDEAGREACRELGREEDNGLEVTRSLFGMWKIWETGRGETPEEVARKDWGGGVGNDLGGILGDSLCAGDF